jgi:UDP-N-acetylmuramoyl-tripeptide--D-alanyl-D-alanine ligase
MRELGDESQKEHAAIVKLLQELKFKNVYLVGEEFAQASKGSAFVSFANVDELISHLAQNPVEGKDILVKGSNSVHLNKTIDSL